MTTWLRHARHTPVRQFLAPLLVAGALLWTTRDLSATQVIELTFEQMVRGASDVVVGRVVSATSRWGDASRRWMLTDYVVDVEQRVLGQGAAGPLTITYWGGTIDGETQRIMGMELPAVGQRHVLLLRTGWQTSAGSPIVGLDQGLFRVEPDAVSGLDLVRARGSQTVRRDGAGRPELATGTVDASSAMSLAEFLAWIQSVPAGPAENLAALSQSVASDPRVMRILRLTPETGPTGAAEQTASRSPARAPGQLPTPRVPDNPHVESIAGEPVARSSETIGPAYSWARPPNAPIVVNQFPASFAPWSPEDQYQMSKWNMSASDLFRVFITPTGTYGWPNNRFDLAGWPSSADLSAVYGYSWDPGTLGVTFSRWTFQIIEADIALNPAYSWTLDDQWVYDGSFAIGFRQTMVHELGHMWGLDHNFTFLSVMNYSPMSLRAYGLPFMDDAEAVRTAYSGRAPSRTDLGVYLFRSTGFQSWSTTPLPASVVAGDGFVVNDFHVENAGTNPIVNPTLDWYLTSQRNYTGSNWFLGRRSFGGTLNRFTYYAPSGVSTWLVVPSSTDGGLYYLNAYSGVADGAAQSGFPYNHSLAWSQSRIRVYPSMSSLDGGVHAGGAVGSATLYLGGRTDSSGLFVTLESSAPDIAGLPASVFVPAFSRQVTFPVTTSAVASRQDISVTAHSNGKTLFGVVVVLPASTVVAKNVSGAIGQRVTLSAKFKQGTTPLVGIPVSFDVSGDEGVFPAVTNTSGVATFRYVIPVEPGLGTRVITATFAGDSEHAAASDTSTLTVGKAPVQITLGRLVGVAGAFVNASATLKRATDKAVIPGATVIVSAFGATYSGVTDALGKATVSIAVPAGTPIGSYPVVATFAGDALHNNGSATKNLVVK
jgi:hypothetical protein